MKKLLILLFLFFFRLHVCLSQSHDHFWFFGYDAWAPEDYYGGSVINFNSEPPTVFRQDREMNIDITMTSVCDSSGVLKFYTNGIAINDTTNQTMLNGDSLNPGVIADNFSYAGYITINSHVIIPMPGYPNKYYLFHLKYDSHPVYIYTNTTFYYTLIDMDLNNGLGGVVEKNKEILSNGRLGTVNAIKHANGRDWWIWVSHEVENKYKYFLLTPYSLDGPFETTISPNFCCPWSDGRIIFSPDGNKAARYNVSHGVYFYDFDRCSGEFSNPVFVPLPDGDLGGGIAFSPNSRFFYLAHDPENIYQYDLWADDIEASRITVATWDGFFSIVGLRTSFFELQLGPDGRIYGNSPNSVAHLHVIDQPNKKGLDCKVLQHSLRLPTLNHFTSPHFPNYRLGPLDGSPCDTLGLDNNPIAKFRYDQDTTDYLSVRFTDLSYYEPAEWSWAFGDGTVSQDTSPVHSYPSDGTYEVCLTVSNQYSSNTFCRTLIIGTGISATQEAAVSDIVSVFPNPAQSATNFRIGGDYLPQQAMLSLYNATGQPVLTQRLTAGWSVVQLESLAPGMYFWEVKDGERVLGTGKLVKVE